MKKHVVVIAPAGAGLTAAYELLAADCILGVQSDKKSLWGVNTEKQYHEEK